MINEEVADRLIANIQAKHIKHDQQVWLRDHKELFVISETDRWGCATSGCAAGHVFLAEGENGMTFDMNSTNVFPDPETALLATFWEHYTYDSNEEVPSDEEIEAAMRTGIDIAEWAGKKLGIWDDEIDRNALSDDCYENYESESRVSFLFFNDLGTDEIINRINFLRTHDDPTEYSWTTKY